VFYRLERSSLVVSRLAILVACLITFSRQNSTDPEGSYVTAVELLNKCRSVLVLLCAIFVFI